MKTNKRNPYWIYFATTLFFALITFLGGSLYILKNANDSLVVENEDLIEIVKNQNHLLKEVIAEYNFLRQRENKLNRLIAGSKFFKLGTAICIPQKMRKK